jgi:iron complex transport system permease protein
MMFIIVCIILCLIVAIYSAMIGSYEISAGRVYEIIWAHITGRAQANATEAHIVINLRLPEILTALVGGMALGVCGTAMQSMLKNPLADPYTMGISSGAGFGAALAIILGIEILAGGGIVVNAFIFSLIPALIILFLSKFKKATPTMMVLCGIALMYLFNAMTQLFMLLADPDDMSTVYTWMIGAVTGTSYDEIAIMLAVGIVGIVIIQYLANQLNIMGIGDEAAQTLGVNVERKRLIALIIVSLMAATVVSFTGIIGFVGLVSPHIVRTIIGADNKYLVPASAVFGALLLLVSDIVAKTVVAPTILPVGVITSCIGGPLFLYLILRNSKEVWS